MLPRVLSLNVICELYPDMKYLISEYETDWYWDISWSTFNYRVCLLSSAVCTCSSFVLFSVVHYSLSFLVSWAFSSEEVRESLCTSSNFDSWLKRLTLEAPEVDSKLFITYTIINPCHAEYIKMPRPLLIFQSELDPEY